MYVFFFRTKTLTSIQSEILDPRSISPIERVRNNRKKDRNDKRSNLTASAPPKPVSTTVSHDWVSVFHLSDYLIPLLLH